MGKISGEKVIAWWYDTRTDEAYKPGKYANEGSVTFDPPGAKHEGNDWEYYISWQTADKKILKKMNELIKDIQKNPFEGIGKPEPLKIVYLFWDKEYLKYIWIWKISKEKVYFYVQL